MTTHVERSIEVNVPVSTVYDQWTQFEDFPRFMGGVQQVRQVGDTLTHWVAEIAGVRREWDAEIVEQVPDEKVAWAATTGATNAGAVFFDAVGTDRTRVRLTLDYEPEGIVEKIGDVLDIVDRQAVADLDRFKQFIESRGAETGGWRGTVHQGGAAGAGVAPGAGVAAAGAAGVPDDITPGAGTARADGDTTASAGERGAGSGVPGDVVAVGPTGDTRSTLDTEAGPSRSGAVPDTPDLGHSGDPLVLDAQSSSHDHAAAAGTDAERTGTAAGAAGVTGFGTDTGLSSSPTSGALTGDPGARAASHAGTGTGDLVGEVGSDRTEWTDQPGARDDVTEAATDPVGEDWAGAPGASTDPGSRSVATGTDAPWAPGGSGPGEDRGTRDIADEGVVERNYADESITTQDVVARDFNDRDVSGEGTVQRDFANRDITERDIANRGIVTGMGGAPVTPQPHGLDALDAPGPADGVGAGREPLDLRTGTADDPDNPSRPSV